MLELRAGLGPRRARSRRAVARRLDVSVRRVARLERRGMSALSRAARGGCFASTASSGGDGVTMFAAFTAGRAVPALISAATLSDAPVLRPTTELTDDKGQRERNEVRGVSTEGGASEAPLAQLPDVTEGARAAGDAGPPVGVALLLFMAAALLALALLRLRARHPAPGGRRRSAGAPPAPRPTAAESSPAPSIPAPRSTLAATHSAPSQPSGRGHPRLRRAPLVAAGSMLLSLGVRRLLVRFFRR